MVVRGLAVGDVGVVAPVLIADGKLPTARHLEWPSGI